MFRKYNFFLLRLISFNKCNFSDSQISAQIDVLNSDYAGTGLKFRLASTTRTTNAVWFNSLGPDESYDHDAKKALRVGGAADLNVYSVG